MPFIFTSMILCVVLHHPLFRTRVSNVKQLWYRKYCLSWWHGLSISIFLVVLLPCLVWLRIVSRSLLLIIHGSMVCLIFLFFSYGTSKMGGLVLWSSAAIVSFAFCLPDNSCNNLLRINCTSCLILMVINICFEGSNYFNRKGYFKSFKKQSLSLSRKVWLGSLVLCFISLL